MATQVLFRRGTTSQNNNFIGGAGELTVNLSNVAVRVHDGTTLGGVEMARADLTNVVGNAISQPGGSNTNVQYNNANVLGGSNAFSFNDTTNTVSMTNLVVGNVAGNLIPSANATYNLGNSTNRWKDLYISGNTIYMDDAQIKAYQQIVLIKGLSITANGAVDVANAPNPGSMFVSANMTAGNVTVNANLSANTANIGNISGNTANYGNIVAGNITVTGNVQLSSIINGNSNVVVNANSAVTVSSNGVSNIMIVNSNGVSATTTFKDDVIVNGNLSVSGNAIYVNVTSQTIENPIVGIGVGSNASPIVTPDAYDRGIAMHEYGTGFSRTTSANIVAGTTFIPLSSVASITIGMSIGNPNSAVSIPIGSRILAVNASNVQINSPVGANIPNGTILNIGTDQIRFMGWDTGNSEFTMASNVTQVGSDITVNQLGNVRARTLLANIVGNTGNFANDVTVGGNLTVTGNLDIAQIKNGNSNVRIAANGNVTFGVTGNANVLTVTDTGISTGNIISGNSNVVLVANGNTRFSVAGNANVMTVTGTGIEVGNIKSGNSNIVLVANGNTRFSVAGNANVLTVTGTGISTGNITSGNSNVVLTANGNISVSSNGVSNIAVVSGSIVQNNYTSTALVTLGSTVIPMNTVAGLANGQVLNASGFLAPNTLITNIASLNVTVDTPTILEAPLGTAFFTTTPTSNVSVADALTVGGVSTLGPVGNVRITGGSNGQALFTDGSGNLSWVTISADKIVNGNSNIVVNANSNINMSVGGTANVVTVTSGGLIVDGNTTITGNLTVQGTTITVNTDTLVVEDPIIELGSGAHGAPLITNDGKDRGALLITYGDGTSRVTANVANIAATFIDLVDTSSIVAGMGVGYSASNAIPVGATVVAVNASNIEISQALVENIASGQTIAVGNNTQRFMGWHTGNSEFAFGSNVTNLNDVITFNALGNVRAGAFLGNSLVNGNSNVAITANGNIAVSVAGNSNVAVFTDTGLSVANIIRGNSNIALTANGNIRMSVGGNANIVTVTGTGANIAGTANITGNTAIGGNVTIAGNLTVAGNINIDFLVNGNSNVVVNENANVTISSNGVADIVTISAATNPVYYTSTAVALLGDTTISLDTVVGLVNGQVLNAPGFLTPGTTITGIVGLDVTVDNAVLVEAPIATQFYTTSPTSLVNISNSVQAVEYFGNAYTVALVANTTTGNIPTLNGTGNLTDSGKTFNDNSYTNSAYWSAGQTSNYVLTQILNMPSLPPVNIATTANVSKSGLAAIDGVTPTANSYILVKNQTNNDNGIWLAQSGAWVRQAVTANAYTNVTTQTTYAELNINNGVVNVLSGTTNKNIQYQITITNSSATFGNSIVYVTSSTKLPIASTYNRFVDIASGNDTNNNGSTAFPFATITRALTGAQYPLTITVGAGGGNDSSAVTWTSSTTNSLVQSQYGASDGGQTSLTGVQTFATGSTRNDFKATVHSTGASAPFVFQSGALMRNYFQDLTISTTASSWITLATNVSNWISLNNINVVNFNPINLPAFTSPFIFYIYNQSTLLSFTGTGAANTSVVIVNSPDGTIRLPASYLGSITFSTEFSGRIGSTVFPEGLLADNTELTQVLGWTADSTYDGYYYINYAGPSSFEQGAIIGKQTAGGVTQTWWARKAGQVPAQMTTSTGNTFLKNVSNVTLLGGTNGQILTTNGSGALSWESPAETQPYIRFVVPANASNQTFTNANIAAYANANVINVVKDGVYLEPDIDYVFANATTIQVTSYLDTNSVIDVLASPAGGTQSGALAASYTSIASIAVGDIFSGSNTTTTLTVGQTTTERPTITNSIGGSATSVPAGTYKFLGGANSACLWTRTA